MKKAAALILAFVLLLSLAGCDKDDGRDNKEPDGDKESADWNIFVPKPGEDDKEPEGDVKEPEGDVKDPVTEPDNPLADTLTETSMEAYKRFLDGGEGVCFDYWNPKGEWDYDANAYGDRFPADAVLTVTELMEAFIDANRLRDDEDCLLGRVEYAYIDCGADGIPELALRFVDFMAFSMDFNELYVIKHVGDRLQLCFSTDYGYRSSAGVNEYGYVQSGGSTGAMSYNDSAELIDGDGVYSFVYSADSEYIDWDNYQILTEEYSLVPLSIDDYFSDAAYADWYDAAKLRTYWLTDANGNALEGEDPSCDYFDDSPYEYLSHSELDARLREHMENLGATDTIVNGDIPEWTELGIG